MKKICFIVDSIFSFGGVQRVTTVIAKELSRCYDVTIVTMDDPSEMNLQMYDLATANLSFRFFKWPLHKSYKVLLCKSYSALYRKVLPHTDFTSRLYAYSSFTPDKRKALTNELKAGNYDVIIGVHAPLAARLATIKRHLGNVKTIGWIHNSFEALFSKESTYIGEELKHYYVNQFKQLDHTLVLCSHDAQTYSAYDSRFIPKVIYNPLTLTPGSKSVGTSKRFLAVGRFSHKHKGFDILIEAFNIFSKRNDDWCLDIVGEGPEEPLYRELIKKYSLEERIKIHPFTQDIQQYYSNSQIYVLSSRWEGFGLVLVEAMSHGLPIVSSDIPTSKEILGDFGMFFKNEDANDLAVKLHEATQIDWNEASNKALDLCKTFELKNIISKWTEVIEP